MLRPGFARLFLTIALLLTLSTAGLVAVVLHWSETWTLDQIDREIEAEVGDLSAFYQQRRMLGLKELVEERSAWRPAIGAVYLLAYRRSGDRLGGNVPRWPQEAVFDKPFTFQLAGENDDAAPAQIRARAVVLNNVFTLLVGRSLEPRMALVRDFQNLLPYLAAAIGALGLAGIFIISRMMLARMETINATARAVEGGEIKTRAPGADRDDEIGDLARNVNRMLDRIEVLLDATRTSTDRIAHELRTPMTRLRARLQQAAGSLSGEARERLEDALDETRKLSASFNALLDISRIEANAPGTSTLPEIDFGEIIAEVVEFYQPAAEERGIAIAFEKAGACVIRGDRDLLQRLVANLVDNSLKFSPDGGKIALGYEVKGGAFRFRVADEGPGIPPDFAETAFERFSRAPESQQKDGFGLGLAIVHAIAQRHGFDVAIEPVAKGTSILVSGLLAA
jgi:signal transduction histidine kinase